jgi:hypothetical protein
MEDKRCADGAQQWPQSPPQRSSIPHLYSDSGYPAVTTASTAVFELPRPRALSHTPHNKWSKVVNNATSHCLIQWPKWTGVLDYRVSLDGQGLGFMLPQLERGEGVNGSRSVQHHPSDRRESEIYHNVYHGIGHSKWSTVSPARMIEQ